MSTSFIMLARRAPLLLHGSGMFLFDGKRHRGGLLISPGGIYEWSAASGGGASGSEGLLEFLDAERHYACDFLLLGTGAKLVPLPPGLAVALERDGLGLEAMDTPAACRTYNVLLAERRQFLAALQAP